MLHSLYDFLLPNGFDWQSAACGSCATLFVGTVLLALDMRRQRKRLKALEQTINAKHPPPPF